ncbi:MAG: hypothetical protein N0C84_13525 [Candidatus Thiodiazotropha taylori]|jgi:hypothetical protein|uniref:Uncharacterized protein n=1 Tax=Candidatus Thiodiazotropha taylori TaxID=2792791 RepID=A0A9E4KEK7_9GAMM|nr:hypothetical protein [Candidatus Thiodiazotropha taylori]MCW4257478.1 hypothetical protein [Candidatus Thiodiazotropha taylori]
MTTWNDFNSAEDQNNFDVIPKGTLVKVRMTIRPGGYDDASQGWTGGYATQSMTTGSVYLNCEFVVLDGPYAKRKMWSLIGLHSPKGPEWANMGRAFVKGILNSSRGLHPQDNSPQAQQARRIQGFADLDGIEFVAKVELDKDQNGDDKNVIKTAITPDHKDYAAVSGNTVQAAASTQPASSPQASASAPTGRPSWAQ